MLEYFIRNFSILTTAIYTFYKLLNISPKKNHVQFLLLLTSLSTSIFTAVFFKTNQSFNLLCALLILFLIGKYAEHLHISITYTTALFSYTFSFILFCVSSLISSLFIAIICYNNYLLPWVFVRILISVIQFILIFICFRIPRLQKGMTFLYHFPSNNIGSTICILLIILIFLFSQAQTSVESYMVLFTSSMLFLGLIVIYWWNYHITQTYKKYLKRNEINSLNLLIEEQNQQIAYLKNEHDKLARIIHKDNKLIPAITMAIIDSKENSTGLSLPELDTDSDLTLILKRLYNERTEILANYQQEVQQLPLSAFNSVNAVLSYMQSLALQDNIQYQLILFDDLTSTIPSEISEDDFVHILSDLLTNAINACRNIPSSAIQIYLGKFDDISTIRILNTGQIFHLETLKNLGQSRHTTHADTGGSGIGLMDIWKIKERYTATLLIDEVTDTSSSQSTVCINILFNHKNHYIIHSDRHKELSAYINRPDIMIFSKD